jgi:hypothetical protein
MSLEYLAELLEKERDLNGVFRDEVRTKLGAVEKWVAVREAREEERKNYTAEQKLLKDARNKQVAWGIGVFLTILGLLTPAFFH